MRRRFDNVAFGAVRMDLLLGLGVAALLAGVVVAIGYTTNQEVTDIFDRSRRNSREIAVDNGTRYAQLLATNTATTVRPSVIDNNFTALREVLAAMASKDDALLYIAVLSADGEVLSSSGIRPQSSNGVLEATAPIRARDREIGRVELVYGMAGVESRIEAAAQESRRHRSEAIRDLVIGGAITLALGLLMAAAFGTWLTRPVTRLARAAEDLGEGQFDVRVGVGGPREIQQLANTFNSMAGQLQQSIKASIERAAIDRELELAHELQRQMMPPEERIAVGRLEIVSWYAPAGTCAGDWWAVDHSAEGPTVTVMVGDVIGHGIPAALYTAAAQSAYHTGDALGLPTSPDQILSTIDAGLRGFAQQNTMSCCCVVVDRDTGELQASVGGHPEPLHITSAGDIDVFEGTGPLLGDPELAGKFRSTRHMLGGGDIVVLYTDGLTEAADAQNKMFGRRRLGKLIAGHRADRLDNTLAAVQLGFREFVGDVPIEDDVTMVLIRFEGEAAS